MERRGAPGIKEVYRCETEFASAIIRTQLFDSADIESVKKIQAGYRALPLSKFLNLPAPPAAPPIAWPKIDKQMAEQNPFGYLNFLLQFCPPTGTAVVERLLRARLAKIGVDAGKQFPPPGFAPENKASLEEGAKRGLAKIKQQIESLGTDEDGWQVAIEAFGNRKRYAGNWTLRASVAMAGIYANDPEEALYPLLGRDSDGRKPDCATNRYTLTFSRGALPPVNAFWSVTMYDGETRLLVANSINRYLINSPMLSQLTKNSDGSITLCLQKDSPGADKESNWLPAPNGLPEPAALNGTWRPPAVHRAV